MTPDVSRFLEVASVHLLTRSLPAVGDAYEQSALGALAVLLSVVREDFDRAAERRVAENAALREIFAQAVDIVEDPTLRGQLEAAAGKGEPSLRVSDLERVNSELRALLIMLHAEVETLDGGAARDCEVRIWRELAASTERRRIAIGPF